MTILKRKLDEILVKVQTGSTEKQFKRLQNLYHESVFEDFLQEFLKCINIVLKMKNDNDPYRDKLLLFLSKFCTSLKKPTDDEELLCPFLKEIFLHLFKEHDPNIISTFRVCQFIKLLLNEIGSQESYLDEDICDQIRDIMIKRMDDIRARVRIQAVEVLQRLQNPQDNNDEIITTFIERLSDDNSLVRKNIIQCMGVNAITIPVIIGRCLDVSDEVRLGSYDKLSKIPMKVLKIAQRQFILRNGLADKSPKIQKFILKSLFPQWLEISGDYFQLIRALKLDADEKDFKQTTTLLEKVLYQHFKNTTVSTIMEALKLDNAKLISSNTVEWEQILFWRCSEQFLREQENEDDYVEKILPELVFFCDYVRNVYTSKTHLKSDWDIVQHDHIMLELLKICHDYDYSEVVGRNALQNLITTILIDGPALYDVTVLLVKMFEKLFPDIEERATKFCEIIAEIQTPLTPVAPSEDMIRKKNVKLAEYRCKLNIAGDKLDTAIDKEDYDRASELKKEIASFKEKMIEISKQFDETNVQRTPKTDTSTICRCLDIMTASLKTEKIKTLPGPYRAFQDIFLPPLLSSRQPEVFWKSLKLLCLFANFDLKLAKASMQVFCAPIIAHNFRPVYGDQTTIIAITCITDMILIYGSDVFDEEDNNVSQKPTNKRKILGQTAIDETVCHEPPPPSLEQVMEILSELVDDTDDKIRETAGDCLISLIMTGRVRSPLLFSKLLLKWFSPNTLKDVRLRQLIARLFTDYVLENRYSLEVLEQAFVPTLQAIIDAPRSSPLADVDVDSVSRFLAALSQPGRHKYNIGLDAHKNIALILCKEICDHPNTKHTHVYLKTLLHLEPPREDEAALDMLLKQVDIMQEIVKEKQSQRYVLKYRHKLNNDLTHNDNTASATSVNSTSNAPETTVNTAVTESHNNTVVTQKDDAETNRYSSLSVKRRKRPSRENGAQPLNGQVRSSTIVRLDGSEEIEKICRRMVISETDSEYATENDLQENKKKNLSTIPEIRISVPSPQNEVTTEISPQRVEVDSPCAPDNPQEQDKYHLSSKPERNLIVRLERNIEIDRMCSVIKKTSSNSEKQSEKCGKSEQTKQLRVLLEQNVENGKSRPPEVEINKKVSNKPRQLRVPLEQNVENGKSRAPEVEINKKVGKRTRQLRVLLEKNVENEKSCPAEIEINKRVSRSTKQSSVLLEQNVEIMEIPPSEETNNKIGPRTRLSARLQQNAENEKNCSKKVSTRTLRKRKHKRNKKK